MALSLQKQTCKALYLVYSICEATSSKVLLSVLILANCSAKPLSAKGPIIIHNPVF